MVPTGAARGPGAALASAEVRRATHRWEDTLFKDVKLGPKIYSVVLLLALVAAATSYVGIDAMWTYNRRVHQMQHVTHAAIVGEQVNGLILGVVMDSRGIYMARDHAEAEKYAPLILKNLAIMKQKMAEWTNFSEPEDKEAMDRANARADEFIAFRSELVRLSREATLDESRNYGDNDQNRSNRTALNREMVALASADANHIQELADRARQFYESKLVTMVILAAIGIALAIFAVFLVFGQVTRPIKRLTAAMGALAAGDKTIEVPARDRGDEIGDMARALGIFQEQAVAAQSLTERVTENIRRVAMAATQASTAVSQVSDGSNIQLTSLKHSAGALEQSAGAIAEVAHSTQLASEQAKQAAELAADGIGQMGRMVEVVNAISQNSGQVTQIGRRLDDIFGGFNAWVGDAVEETDGGAGEKLLPNSEFYIEAEDEWVAANLAIVPLRDGRQAPLGTMLVIEDMQREKELRRTMSRYMSNEVIDRLMIDTGGGLEGSAHEATILFSDIRGFTTLSERLGAGETVSMLNEYFSFMEDVVTNRSGLIDKYIGDAIMALFGSPFPTDHDAVNAVQAATDMFQVLQMLNTRRAADGKAAIRIGVGIGTGTVITGNIGSPKRMDFTVIGDPVNLASRVETATKTYGAEILVCGTTWSRLASPPRARRLDLVRLRGQTRPTELWEILDRRPDIPDAAIETYGRALDAYIAGDWGRALRQFEEALVLRPGDKPASLMVGRCRGFLAAPPED